MHWKGACSVLTLDTAPTKIAPAVILCGCGQLHADTSLVSLIMGCTGVPTWSAFMHVT